MDISSQKVKIVSAVVIAASMIGIAFWFSNSSPKLASALSTDELLRAYVEQDTDGDGLPDWQEEVYGTDPGNPSSVEAGMTDADAVARGLVTPAYLSEEVPDPITDADIPVQEPAANSLTERFSRQFMEEYFAAGGGTNVSEEEQAKIIENLITTFAREAEAQIDSSYTRVSLKAGGVVDTRTYIGTLEAFIQSSLPTENSDMPGLAKEYIERGDAKAGARLEELSGIYGAMAQGLINMSVPEDLKDEHLLLARAYDRVGNAGAILARYEDDPISALGALSVFIPARDDIFAAFNGFAEAVLRDGEPTEGEPGYLTVQLVRSQEQQ